tara:strand:- start:470 stop:601 length:132 start_codon:yes stop_codon:yes gene_type:complete
MLVAFFFFLSIFLRHPLEGLSSNTWQASNEVARKKVNPKLGSA